MEVMVKLSRAEVNALQYQIVVEMWKNKDAGVKNKNAWLTTFSEEERKLAETWYKTFYGWYLYSGTPEPVMSPKMYLWLQNKLIPYFANL